MALRSPDSCSTEDLARACAQQASRRQAPPCDLAPCYELFCRAFAAPPDSDAWQAIMAQYHKLVSFWLGQYADEDTTQEVFLRFWLTQQNASASFTSRFLDITFVLQYLKRCAIAVRIETWRVEEKQHKLFEALQDHALVELVTTSAQSMHRDTDTDLQQLVLSRLTQSERIIFELTYYYALSPREIQVERPNLFQDVKTVHRIKENILKRLRRDPNLREWWTNCCEDDEDNGGKMASTPV